MPKAINNKKTDLFKKYISLKHLSRHFIDHKTTKKYDELYKIKMACMVDKKLFFYGLILL